MPEASLRRTPLLAVSVPERGVPSWPDDASLWSERGLAPRILANIPDLAERAGRANRAPESSRKVALRSILPGPAHPGGIPPTG